MLLLKDLRMQMSSGSLFMVKSNLAFNEHHTPTRTCRMCVSLPTKLNSFVTHDVLLITDIFF